MIAGPVLVSRSKTVSANMTVTCRARMSFAWGRTNLPYGLVGKSGQAVVSLYLGGRLLRCRVHHSFSMRHLARVGRMDNGGSRVGPATEGETQTHGLPLPVPASVDEPDCNAAGLVGRARVTDGEPVAGP